MTIYTAKAYDREFVAATEDELFDLVEEYEDSNEIFDIAEFDIEVKD